MVQTRRNQIKAYTIQIEKNSESPSKTTALYSLGYHDTQHGNTHDSTSHKTRQQQHTRRSDTRLTKPPILLVGEAVACRRPGALVNKLESTWLERIWLGRDSKTDEHLIGTANGMVRSRALKRSVERRRWDPSLLKAMVWDPWNPTPVTRGRPLKFRSDREPILMGPIPRVRFTLPDEPDAVTTAAPAVPVQETTSATAT